MNILSFLCLLDFGLIEYFLSFIEFSTNFIYSIDFKTLILLAPITPTNTNLEEERDTEPVSKSKGANPPMEFELCEDYLLDRLSGKFIYDSEISQWYYYNNTNIWEAIKVEDLKLVLIGYLKEHPLIKNKIKMSYLRNVIEILETLLNTDFRKFSNNYINYIPFKNGILNLETSELLSFSPDYKFTYKLNIDYDPNAKMSEEFVSWLKFISNEDPLFLDVLRAYVYLIFTRNNRSHVALYLHGPAGTGKSTFEKLVVSIVSQEASVSTDLKRLNSTFESSKLINKSLLLLPDIDDKINNVNKLKLIISGDMIAAEKKFQQPFEFFPTCLVIISSNHTWQPSDTSSGIQRRMVYLPFNNIPTERDPNLFYLDPFCYPKGKLAKSLPGFINWILANPLENLSLFTKDIPLLNNQLSPNIIGDTNPVLDWMQRQLIYTPGQHTHVGNAKSPKESHLYSNYLYFCLIYNYKPISFHKFSSTIQDLCFNNFGWKGVIKKEITSGTVITNITLNPHPASKPPTINNNNKTLSSDYFKGFIEGDEHPQTLFKGIKYLRLKAENFRTDFTKGSQYSHLFPEAFKPLDPDYP